MSKEGSGLLIKKKAGLNNWFRGNIIGKRQGTDDFKKIDLKSYRHGARWRWLWRLFRFYFWTGNNGNTKENIVTRHPLELIIFSDEEGSLLGSKALAEHLIKEC
jgi:N-carbamoyl-L-amino-acid hydrolase